MCDYKISFPILIKYWTSTADIIIDIDTFYTEKSVKINQK